MRANGMRSLAVSCRQCHHEAVLNAGVAIDPTTGETKAALKLTYPNYSGAGRLRHARPSTRHRAGAAEAAGARRSSAKTVNGLLTTFVGSA